MMTKRLLILGPYQSIGGVSTFVEEIALAFVRQDYEVVVVTFKPLLEKTDFPKGIKVIAPWYPRSKTEKVAYRSIALRLKSLLAPTHWNEIRKALTENSYDLVISNLYYSALIGIAKSNKKIHVIHGFRGFNQKLISLVHSLIANYSNILGSKIADLTISNSYLTAAINRSMFNIDSHVVPLGVSLTNTPSLGSEGERTIDILYVGRIVSAKLIPLILRALAVLSKEQDKLFNFSLIGKGVETENLIKLTRELSLENQVTFHGYLPRAKISEYYTKSRCFISLNPTEPFGLTYLEALAHGVPIVLCRGCGLSAFFDERCACLVDCQVDSVAEGISKALTSRWDREWMSRYILENFSWDRTVESILDKVHGGFHKAEVHTDPYH